MNALIYVNMGHPEHSQGKKKCMTNKKNYLFCEKIYNTKAKLLFFWYISFRFLGCVYLRRFIQHHIRQDQSLTSLQSSDPPDPAKSVIMFRVEGLTCRVISYASNQHQVKKIF